MICCQIALLRVRGLDLRRILGRESTAGVVNKDRRLGIRYFLDTSTAGVVIIATNYICIRILLCSWNVQVTNDRLLVVSVKSKPTSFSIFDRIAI